MIFPSTLQQLPPKWAHFCLKTEAFIQKELGLEINQKRLLISLSGGVDSTALLLFCYILKKRWQSELFAAHLNHKLRPESDQEALEVAKLCSKLNIPLFTGSSNIKIYAYKHKIGTEEAGRILRYRFLFGIQKKIEANYLLTAHHLNDLAEEMIMRQLRGTSWPAFIDMPAWNNYSGLLRPFLLTPKKNLISFVQELKISWQEDKSNLDQTFTRNRIRHTILPLFEKENPNFLQQVKQSWKKAQIDKDFWDSKIQRLTKYEQIQNNTIILPNQELKSNHQALRLRWYKHVLIKLGKGQVLSSNLFKVDEAWQKKSKGKVFQFPGNKRVKIIHQGICFYLEN